MQKTRRCTPFTDILAILALAFCAGLLPTAAQAAETRTLNVLFIGNSFTHRGRLPQIVKEMAEAGNPGLRFEYIAVGGSGAKLGDHWRGGTPDYVRLADLTAEEKQASIKSLEDTLAKDPKDLHAKAALGRHRKLGSERRKWDIVALQSYGDDMSGDASLYVEYAQKFAELIKAHGARVVLYETTPATMNAKPLAAPPEPAAVMAKAQVIAALANRIDAAAVPMSMVALRCQTARPDFTLRFINDGHPNHTMAYLTACTFYAALFERSPEGLPVDTVTDIRFLDNDNKDKDLDGKPITRTFSRKDRADLQRIAWEGFRQFQQIRKGEGN